MHEAKLLRDFQSGQIDPAQFHHLHHIQIVWLLLQTREWTEALPIVRRGLQLLTEKAGRPGAYHETITCAFVVLVQQRRKNGQSWEEFQERNADLFAWKPSVLDRYYKAETLAADRSRQLFVLPDAGL